MNDALKEYLNDPTLVRKAPRFLKDEAPEITLGIYMALKNAIRRDCPIIEITNEEFKSRKQVDGPLCSDIQFPIWDLTVPLTVRQYFELILGRDKIIRSNIELIHEDKDKTVYRLL